ncbi:MAG: hypothetical protein LRS43_00220 [Desulfurococcales archaeon]|nr:hypothetical protein [Desulfurococcales archaeon]
MPGHAAPGGPSKRLQKFLASRGASFEAEGDTTRVHFNGWILEVRDEPGGGFSAIITLSLADEGPSRDTARAACEAFSLAMALKGGIRYEVDESLPGYPMLRIIVSRHSLDMLVEDLMRALEKYL